MNDILYGLMDVIKNRKDQPEEKSYTCYLFQQGLDKILKKCGEECAEVIIAAKNGDNKETTNEICDLLYHLLVLMAQQELPLEDVMAKLEMRGQKIGNLKELHQVDKDS